MSGGEYNGYTTVPLGLRFRLASVCLVSGVSSNAPRSYFEYMTSYLYLNYGKRPLLLENMRLCMLTTRKQTTE